MAYTEILEKRRSGAKLFVSEIIIKRKRVHVVIFSSCYLQLIAILLTFVDHLVCACISASLLCQCINNF